MKTLIVDTSSPDCAVTVCNDGKFLTIVKRVPKKHNLYIIDIIRSALKKTNIGKYELDFLAYGIGPGSFVGVRLAFSVLQAISVVIKKPVIGFSSMTLVANFYSTIYKFNRICVILDARMNDFYVGEYIYNDIRDIPAYSRELCIKSSDVELEIKKFSPQIILGENIDFPIKPKELVYDCKYAFSLVKDKFLKRNIESDNAPIYFDRS